MTSRRRSISSVPRCAGGMAAGCGNSYSLFYDTLPAIEPARWLAGASVSSLSRYRVDARARQTCYERVFLTSQGSPLTRLRRALAGGDLVAARTAAGDLPHVGLEEVAALLVLIAEKDPETVDAAAVRFLGRACLERSFITLDDALLLAACLAQLERSDSDSRASFAGALRRVRRVQLSGSTAGSGRQARPRARGEPTLTRSLREEPTRSSRVWCTRPWHGRSPAALDCRGCS